MKALLLKIKRTFVMSKYMKYYRNRELKPKMILIESKKGEDFAGNILEITKELLKDEYEDYKIVISCYKNAKENIIWKIGKGRRIKYVRTASFKYFKMLALAKYLITDTTFPKMYIKKEGQVMVNTWHGTPLKKMGRHVESEAFSLGNVQRNLLMSDYLIYPNEYMKEKMIDAYMLDGLYQGKILLEGYPRNTVFLNEDLKSRRKYHGKKYLYLPTWRGNVGRVNNEQNEVIYEHLKQIDAKLAVDEVMYVKLHPFVSERIDFSKFKKVKKFPRVLNEYEFISECDVCVTDYSSVMFDFINSDKKVVLFTYDEEEYLKDRGLYINLNELPFPCAKTVDELIVRLREDMQYDNEELKKIFCTYEDKDATRKICRHVLFGENLCKEVSIYNEDKENVVMYTSSLAKSGLTTAVVNLLEQIDSTKRNYYACFRENALRKFPERIKIIPDDYGFIPIASDPDCTVMEAICYTLFFKMNIETNNIKRHLDELFKREVRKSFGSIRVDIAIQYSGYERGIINLFERFDAKRVIFVHNDMIQEMKTRQNQHYKTLVNAYRNYDAVAVVTKDIKEATLKISQKEDNIHVINNCHDYKNGLIKAQSDVVFDADTQCNVSYERLQEILDSRILTKFITIGRFSPEKAHFRLMDAFDDIYKDDKEVALIIIGGHGKLYEKTLEYANSLESANNIVIIKSISNPYSILKKCSLFVLSSLYEGLGLVLLEADTVGVPVISTNITGPRGFMRKYGGKLVNSSKEGLEKGMRDFIKNGLAPLNVDYAKYNEKCVEQFEEMLDNL